MSSSPYPFDAEQPIKSRYPFLNSVYLSSIFVTALKQSYGPAHKWLNGLVKDERGIEFELLTEQKALVTNLFKA